MKFVLPLAVTALLLASCAGPRVPVFAFGAIQCQETRVVVCVPGAYLTEDECASLVGGAVADINNAVGYEVLHYAGTISRSDADEAVLAHLLVVQEGNLKPGFLGVTNVHEYQHCLSTVYTALSSDMLKGAYEPYGVVPRAVLAHELIHALGAGHADGATQSFGSVMAAATTDDHAAVALTDMDKITLQLAYPWRLQLARRINALLGREVL